MNISSFDYLSEMAFLLKPKAFVISKKMRDILQRDLSKELGYVVNIRDDAELCGTQLIPCNYIEDEVLFAFTPQDLQRLGVRALYPTDVPSQQPAQTPTFGSNEQPAEDSQGKCQEI